MSDEKRYTERDLILAKRAAVRLAMLGRTNYSMENIDALTRELFPLPKLTRARVVKDTAEGYWLVCDGELRWTVFSDGDGSVSIHSHFRSDLLKPKRERVALWADLLANPTEEVQE